jgi:hypothetical protein
MNHTTDFSFAGNVSGDATIEECRLKKDIYRDCCMDRPLMMCRVFALVSSVIFALSVVTSLLLYLRRHKIGKETFNLPLHLLINMTFLSRVFIYLDNTALTFNWTTYIMLNYLPNIFQSMAIITFVVQW